MNGPRPAWGEEEQRRARLRSWFWPLALSVLCLTLLPGCAMPLGPELGGGLEQTGGEAKAAFWVLVGMAIGVTVMIDLILLPAAIHSPSMCFPCTRAIVRSCG